MSGDECILICLYVDDMLIFGTNMDLIKDIKFFLSSHFEMKDLGEANIILGVIIRKNENDLSLYQSHYVENLLKKFYSFNVSLVKTPYTASKHLKKNKGDSVSQPEYAKIIGPFFFVFFFVVVVCRCPSTIIIVHPSLVSFCFCCDVIAKRSGRPFRLFNFNK